MTDDFRECMAQHQANRIYDDAHMKPPGNALTVARAYLIIRTLWVVMACSGYEGTEMIEAYTDKEAAEQRAAAANTYHKARPGFVTGGTENDPYANYHASQAAWIAGHPYTHHYTCDEFIVVDCPFITEDL